MEIKTLPKVDAAMGARVSLGILDRGLRLVAADEGLADLAEVAPDRSFVALLPDADRARIRAGLAELVSGGRASLCEGVAGTAWQELIASRLSVGKWRGGVAVVLRGGSAEPEPMPGLGQVEARVVEGIARGESTAQLAQRLFLSRSGVDYHVGRLMRRFRVPNRVALVSRVHALGLMCTCCWPPCAADGHLRPS